jgi:hypothetical protein
VAAIDFSLYFPHELLMFFEPRVLVAVVFAKLSIIQCLLQSLASNK